MKYDNQLRYARTVVEAYKGEMPLHAWLKNFFREHKQMGSRDRRQLGNLVYGFYRLGHALRDMGVEERLLLGLFLCNEEPGALLEHFRPDWNAALRERMAGGGLDGADAVTRAADERMAGGAVAEKIAVIRNAGIDFVAADIFPWKEALSPDVDHEAFCLSFFRQPDLFLRVRPHHAEDVLRKAGESGALFIPPATLRLPNGFKVEEKFRPDVEVVVQDYSSQRVAEWLPEPAPISCWDACAASGGKSIMVCDRYPGIKLTVSDIRKSILHNLGERFRLAGIGQYRSFVADLTAPGAVKSAGDFDMVLADVPCTGSGTWSRTPEELYFFEPEKIGVYSDLQRRIMKNIIPMMKKGAYLIYSTCSVFREENEDITALICGQYGLEPEKAGNILGYRRGADSMYAMRCRI